MSWYMGFIIIKVLLVAFMWTYAVGVSRGGYLRSSTIPRWSSYPIRYAMNVSYDIESSYPSCKNVCNGGSVQEVEMNEMKFLTLISTRIPELMPESQFNLFIHPITVDKYASQELLKTGVNHFILSKVFIRIIPLLEHNLVFDLGANIGYFAHLSATLGANVVAVEPTHYHGSLLKASISLNPKIGKQIRLLQAAIVEDESSAPEQLCLQMKDVSNAGNTAVSSDIKSGKCNPYMVANTMSLESIIRSSGSPSFIKVDMEGFEMMALRGGAKALSKSPPEVIVIEYNSYTFRGKQTTNEKQNIEMANELVRFFFESTFRGDYVMINLSEIMTPLDSKEKWLEYLTKSPEKKWNDDFVIARQEFVEKHGSGCLNGEL